MSMTTDWMLRIAFAASLGLALLSPSCNDNGDPSEMECARQGKPTQRMPGGRQKCHGD